MGLWLLVPLRRFLQRFFPSFCTGVPLPELEFHGFTDGFPLVGNERCDTSFRIWVNAIYMAFTRSKFCIINCKTGSLGFGSEVVFKGSSGVWVFGVTTDVIFGWIEMLVSFSTGAGNGSPPLVIFVSHVEVHGLLEFYKLVENYGRFGQRYQKIKILKDLLKKIKITEDIS
ncbi:hypothetical protein Tco_1440188 [Tanacetum coccineum]